MPRKKKVEKRDYLTENELLRLKLLDLEIMIEQAKKMINDRDIEILNMKKVLLDKDIMLKSNELEKQKNNIVKTRTKGSEYVKKLGKELGVTSSKWGYDPDTGEVTEN